MSRIVCTPEMERVIRALRADLVPIEEVAERLGVIVKTARRMICELGLDPTARRRKPSFWDAPGRIEMLRVLHARGYSLAEIGRRMGVTKDAVIGKAHRLNLPQRPPPHQRKQDRITADAA